MTAEQNTPKPEDANTPEGFTDITGPAAFKAQAAQNNESEHPNTEDSAAESQESELIVKLETALAETRDQLLRTVADMDNLRKRSVREREDALKYSISGFAKDLLDVADTFRRALESIPQDLQADERISPLVQGIEATERALLSCFEKNGLRKIEPMEEIFNPNFHEVMFETPMPDKTNGEVIQIIEPGYMLHDRLLRPARVGVAKSDVQAPHSIDTKA